MTVQTLYVDYSGGLWQYWYYSEGITYRNAAHDHAKIRQFYQSQGFNKIIYTDEAKTRL